MDIAGTSPPAGSPRLIQAQKTRNTITDGQGNALRIWLHADLKRAAPPVPKGWVDRVSEDELVSHLVGSAVFLVSVRKGTRHVLNLPIEWSLLWAVPADQTLRFWMLEYEHLSVEDERQIVRAALLRHTCSSSKRSMVEFVARCRFLAESKRGIAKLLGMSEPALHYYTKVSRTAQAGPVPNPSTPLSSGTTMGTEEIRHAQTRESPREECTLPTALEPRRADVANTLDRDSAGVVESQDPGPPGHAAPQGTRPQERKTPSQLSWLGDPGWLSFPDPDGLLYRLPRDTWDDRATSGRG